MDFRTELTLTSARWTLGLRDPVITFGSCFADTIGKEFQANKFIASVNPFGTTYHPLAIDRLIHYALLNQLPPEETYVTRSGVVYNLDFHSSFSGETVEQLRDKIRQALTSVHQALKTCKAVMLTYGTAWLYELADSGRPVANCHKMPSAQFRRRLATVEEITSSFRQTLALSRSVNPTLKVILTVSPVRHLRDTLPLNSVSKATLLLACHQLAQEDVDYFPAYELLVDDLRDYRFYADDMIHPSAQAEAYIWNKFCDVYFSGETIDLLTTWSEVRQALGHRAFHPGSDAHQEFLRGTLQKLEALLPRMDVRQEIVELKKQLNHQPA